MSEKAYQTVYQNLKKQIQENHYPVGTLLPPEPQLETIYSVSRTTIRKAISLLAEEGYIHVQQGRGTMVLSVSPKEPYYKFHNVSGIKEIFTTSQKKLEVRSRYIDTIRANQKTADALDVSVGDEIYQIQRLLYQDGKPFSLMRNYVRKDVAPNLEQYLSALEDLYVLLKDKYEVVFHTGEEHITAIAAGFVESQLLGLSPGDPVLFCTRYAYTETTPMEMAETYLRTDCYELVVQMTGWPAYGTSIGSYTNDEKNNLFTFK